jgi:sugar lactone lactonase YvrE
MGTGNTAGLILSVSIAAAQMGIVTGAYAADANMLRAISEQTASGFAFPESVAYDPAAKVLYVGQFGGTELKPAEKDGKGKISKVSLEGKILEEQFLPASGEIMNKPKGIWVKGNRLWVTDIDAVWIFDLKTRKGRKLEIPGITFANDPAIKGNVLYVSDNRADQLYSVEPADFLNAKSDPKFKLVFSGKSVNPNGLYPAKDGSLLMVGFKSDKEARGIYSLDAKGKVKPLSKDIGRLDGIYEMKDGTLLATDWNSGSLFSWSAKSGMQTLASGFKGPADFCVIPEARGYMVVVPDLVKGELRMIRLGK